MEKNVTRKGSKATEETVENAQEAPQAKKPRGGSTSVNDFLDNFGIKTVSGSENLEASLNNLKHTAESHFEEFFEDNPTLIIGSSIRSKGVVLVNDFRLSTPALVAYVNTDKGLMLYSFILAKFIKNGTLKDVSRYDGEKDYTLPSFPHELHTKAWVDILSATIAKQIDKPHEVIKDYGGVVVNNNDMIERYLDRAWSFLASVTMGVKSDLNAANLYNANYALTLRMKASPKETVLNAIGEPVSSDISTEVLIGQQSRASDEKYHNGTRSMVISKTNCVLDVLYYQNKKSSNSMIFGAQSAMKTTQEAEPAYVPHLIITNVESLTSQQSIREDMNAFIIGLSSVTPFISNNSHLAPYTQASPNRENLGLLALEYYPFGAISKKEMKEAHLSLGGNNTKAKDVVPFGAFYESFFHKSIAVSIDIRIGGSLEPLQREWILAAEEQAIGGTGSNALILNVMNEITNGYLKTILGDEFHSIRVCATRPTFIPVGEYNGANGEVLSTKGISHLTMLKKTGGNSPEIMKDYRMVQYPGRNCEVDMANYKNAIESVVGEVNWIGVDERITLNNRLLKAFIHALNESKLQFRIEGNIDGNYGEQRNEVVYDSNMFTNINVEPSFYHQTQQTGSHRAYFRNHAGHVLNNFNQ